MRTVTYRLVDLQRAIIPLGFVGENEHTRIIFDAKKVFDDYPSALPALTVQPPQGESYPAVVVRDGDMVTWDVSDSDLIHHGSGELQLAFTQDSVKVRTFIARTKIDRSIVPNGEAPEPLEDFLEEASAAVSAIPQTIEDALAAAKASGEFDGADGQDGAPGAPGADGVSPTVAVAPITDGHEVTITDKNGAHTFDVMNGEKGDPGTPGDPTTLIDDTTTTATNKVWSAKKSATEVSQLNSALNDKYTKPASGIPASDLASGVIPAVPVTDVQINGSSILNQGVANVPEAGTSTPGVVKVSTNYGTFMQNGIVGVSKAGSDNIKSGTHQCKAIVPYNQHESAFYGLAKAAGADMKNLSSVTVGQYPEAQKVAIQKMLGIYQAPWELIRKDTFTNAEEADHIITVDGNGQAFELTDVRLLFELPNVDSAAAKGYYGQIWFYYGETKYIAAEAGGWSRTATDNAKGCWYFVEYENGMVTTKYGAGTVSTNSSGLKVRYFALASNDTPDKQMGIMIIDNFAINKINIKSVTGTAQYKLYGRRKWT